MNLFLYEEPFDQPTYRGIKPVVFLPFYSSADLVNGMKPGDAYGEEILVFHFDKSDEGSLSLMPFKKLLDEPHLPRRFGCPTKIYESVLKRALLDPVPAKAKATAHAQTLSEVRV